MRNLSTCKPGPAFLLCFLLLPAISLYAQSEITINKVKLNRIDKQKRKQGDWVFFDADGNILLSCVFANNRVSGPVTWYENTDTAFIRFPANGDRETFIVYEQGRIFYGDYIIKSDSTYEIEIEPDKALTDTVIEKIKKYRKKQIPPLYYFGQKKIRDYISAAFNSIRYTFNKPVHILVSVSDAGLVTDVEFPESMNRLSDEEKRELYSAFIGMPRWQPVFDQNHTRASKVLLSRNSSISVHSSEY